MEYLADATRDGGLSHALLTLEPLWHKRIISENIEDIAEQSACLAAVNFQNFSCKKSIIPVHAFVRYFWI